MAGTPPSRRAQVVIIGGGIMGVSTAWHLARAGATGVVVLEAGELACGSSGKPLGGVRAQFSDPTNIALGQRSLRTFLGFADEFGVDIGFQQVGYLFAISDEADVARFEATVALQHEHGVPSRMITPEEAAPLCPYLDPSKLVAALWSPGDGIARPVDVVNAYAAAARDLGVTIRTGTRVVGIDGADGEAVVRTDDGTAYGSPAVVCAAGAWSRAIGAMVGVDLPVEPVRRQIAFTAPLDPPPAPIPMTIGYSTTAYFHAEEHGGLLLGWADPAQPIGFDRDVTTDWHDSLRTALSTFAPRVADLLIAHGWAGLYEMTPDCNAVIGEAEAGFRFLYAAGFSGHGFLQGPAVGECVADLCLGRTPAVDVSGFDVRRFRGPSVRTELGII